MLQDKTNENLVLGNVRREGSNQLGVVLMQIRAALKQGNLYRNWIQTSGKFKLIDNHALLPEIELEANDDSLTSLIQLCNQPYYMIGSDPRLDGEHAAVVIDEDEGVFVVDLGSEMGTQVNGTKLVSFVPKQVHIGSII